MARVLLSGPHVALITQNSFGQRVGPGGGAAVKVCVAEGRGVGGAGVRVGSGTAVSVGPGVAVGTGLGLGSDVALGVAGSVSVGPPNPTTVKVGRGLARVGVVATAVAAARPCCKLLARSAARQPRIMTSDKSARPKTVRGDGVR